MGFSHRRIPDVKEQPGYGNEYKFNNLYFHGYTKAMRKGILVNVDEASFNSSNYCTRFGLVN